MATDAKLAIEAVYHGQKPAMFESQSNGSDYIAATGFMARLCASPNPVLNSSLWFLERGYGGIVRALEYKDWQTSTHFNGSIVAVCTWFCFAGVQIYEQCKRGEMMMNCSALWFKDPWNGSGRHDELWKEKGGLSVERWQFWKSRFEAVVKDEKTSSSAKFGARSAVSHMTRIEEEN